MYAEPDSNAHGQMLTLWQA